MKIWEKGISIDQKIERFTVGNDRELDYYLAKYDLQASVVHANMLEKVKLITKEENEALKKVLLSLQKQLETGNFNIEAAFEDIHSKIEYELINVLGETGKKIHTGRSRNDQVLVAMLLFYKDHLSEVKNQVRSTIELLIKLAEKYQDVFLPGYTHLQIAMPSSFGLWFSAYAELMIDDLYLLDAAIKIVDQNPLGSAAGYGTSFPIDREYTTKALGFSSIKVNVVAAQLSREKTARAVGMALSAVAHTLNKFSSDVCLYMNQHFNFLSLPNSLTTGSSIMPHKKNPDLFEIMRAKCNVIQASVYKFSQLTNNLPSGYHRDYQLLKEDSIKGVICMEEILEVLLHTLPKLQVSTIDTTAQCYRYINSVDAINELVMQGKSFREAYQIIAKQIEEGTYTYPKSIKHSHIGSKDNLGISLLLEKLGEL